MMYGLVLAGGRSRRFGAEKALATLGRVSLLEMAVNHLSRDCEAVAVSAPANSGAAALAASLDLPVLADRAGDPEGPLSGLRAGLAWAGGRGGEFLATIPCDAPLLPSDLARRLFDGLGGAEAAAAWTADGVQPLCAVWRVRTLAGLEAELARGHPPVHAVLERLNAARVAFEDAEAFLNVNTPEDLALAQARATAP